MSFIARKHIRKRYHVFKGYYKLSVFCYDLSLHHLVDNAVEDYCIAHLSDTVVFYSIAVTFPKQVYCQRCVLRPVLEPPNVRRWQ